MRRKGDHQRFGSGHAKCKAEYRRFPHVYDWREEAKSAQTSQGTASARQGGRSAHSTGSKTRDLADRAWCQIAGPELSPTSLRLATLSIDQADRIERINDRVFKKAALIGPKDAPINLLGGYRFPNAPKLPPHIRIAGASTSRWKPTGNGKDMPDIPCFLRREMPIRMAA
jgi:hypothetical protein